MEKDFFIDMRRIKLTDSLRDFNIFSYFLIHLLMSDYIGVLS